MSRVLLPLLLMGLLWGCDQNPAPSADSPTVMASLSGTLIYPQSPTLPADARIQVQLRDVSRADAPALVMAEVNLTLEERKPPLSFTLNYDPARLQLQCRRPHHRCRWQAAADQRPPYRRIDARWGLG